MVAAFGSLSLTADFSVSRRALILAASLGVRMTTLPGAASSIIVGVNSGCWSSMTLEIVSLQDSVVAGRFPYQEPCHIAGTTSMPSSTDRPLRGGVFHIRAGHCWHRPLFCQEARDEDRSKILQLMINVAPCQPQQRGWTGYWVFALRAVRLLPTSNIVGNVAVTRILRVASLPI